MPSDKRFNYTEIDTPAIGPIPVPPSGFLNREAYAGELLAAGWRAFSDHVRSATGRPSANYYAEKTPHHVVKSLDSSIPYCFIALLRDPRDVFLSIKNFNEKRQKKAFGWREGQSDREFAVQFLPKLKMAFSWARRAERAENGLLVCYEDLIRNPEYSYSKIGDFLKTTVRAPEGAKIFTVHGTSESPLDSVGGWRKALDPAIADMITRSVDAELNEFGYAD